MSISIIIVTYNVAPLLRDCLNSIFSQPFKDFEIFVIDNGRDNTEQMIKKEFKNRLTYIKNHKNLGFSKANNIGIKKAKGKYILVLNPDTKLEPRTLAEMHNFMERKKNCAVSTCKVVFPNGKLDRTCMRGFPTPWRAFTKFSGLQALFPKIKLFGGYNQTYLDESKEQQVDAVGGAFMFVRSSAVKGGKKGQSPFDQFNHFDQLDHSKAKGQKHAHQYSPTSKRLKPVGLLDESYWAFGEDIDWCYRFKQAGWEVWYNPKTKITHYKGASGGIKKSSKEVTQATKKDRERWTRAFYDSMVIFYKKNYIKKYPWLVTQLVFAGVWLKKHMALFTLKLKQV